MKSWKTTIGGALVALGQVFVTSNSAVLWWIGKGFLIFGPILLGASAIDSSRVKDEAKHDS